MKDPRPPAPARRGLRPAADGDVAPDGLGFLLGVAHRGRRRAWETRLADLEITAPQAALLRLVTAQPGQGVRQLARRLGTDAMNARRVAETLIAAGLCQAGQDPGDARRRPLHPTDKGRVLAGEVARRAEQAEADLIEALGDGPYGRLLGGLRALIDHDRRLADPPASAPESKRDVAP